MLNIKEIISVSLILFSVIDIPGSLPIVINLRKKGSNIQAGKASIIAGCIMIGFLLAGESILRLFGVDISSFAVAGALVILLIGLEMILGIHLFRETSESSSSTVVPIAFPLIAGAGTLTTILTLKAEFHQLNILIGILINLVLVFLVLRSSNWIERKIGQSGADVLRKVFGIILIAIAVKLFKEHLFTQIKLQ
ncbi:MAG: MarC family protein [Saprospiraceae bacterium]|nr:MarC family protein [Saprospiraceae bacterium]